MDPRHAEDSGTQGTKVVTVVCVTLRSERADPRAATGVEMRIIHTHDDLDRAGLASIDHRCRLAGSFVLRC